MLIAAILASAMGFIDGSVVSIAIPAIRSDLAASLAQGQWISNAYMLFLSSLILIGGAAGDRFGLRLVFSLGVLGFAIASALSALAPTPALLIAARGLQGIAAAFVVPGSLAIIAKAYPKGERGRAIGIWAAASAITTAAGPVIGGGMLTAFGDWSWRLIFAVNLPVGIFALWLLWFRVPPDSAGMHRKLDLAGGGLVTLSLFLLAYGMTGAGEGGQSGVVGPGVWSAAGALFFAAFLVREWRCSEPMMPLELFASRQFSGANAATFFLYFSLSAVLFFLPMTLIGGWGVSPAQTALVMVPLSVAIAVLSNFAGRLADRFGPGPPIVAGTFLVAAAYAGLALTMDMHAFWEVLLPLLALMGIGMALVVSPLSTAVMTAVEDEETGIASGINNAVARVAGLMAVALMGSVVVWAFSTSLSGAGLNASEFTFGLMPAGSLPADVEGARVAATDHGFAALAWVTAALSGFSCVIALVTLEMRLPAARSATQD